MSKNRLQGKKRGHDTPKKGNMQIVGQNVTTKSSLPMKKGRKKGY